MGPTQQSNSGWAELAHFDEYFCFLVNDFDEYICPKTKEFDEYKSNVFGTDPVIDLGWPQGHRITSSTVRSPD